MMGGGGKGDGISDPDQVSDPDPIPQLMAGGPAKQNDGPKKSKTGLIIIVALLLTLICLVGALVLFKSSIIRAIPASEEFYEVIGLGGLVLGEGLELKVSKSSFETESGKDVLIVVGTIKNIVDDARDVPMLKVSLFDSQDTLLRIIFKLN